MRISDWSSDVCSSDLEADQEKIAEELGDLMEQLKGMEDEEDLDQAARLAVFKLKTTIIEKIINLRERVLNIKRIANFEAVVISVLDDLVKERSEEHTSELQSLMRISYAVFCLKKKIKTQRLNEHNKRR